MWGGARIEFKARNEKGKERGRVSALASGALGQSGASTGVYNVQQGDGDVDVGAPIECVPPPSLWQINCNESAVVRPRTDPETIETQPRTLLDSPGLSWGSPESS